MPFASIPAERLSAGGYVQTTPEGMFYYSPDAEVLLSDAFLDDHCFRTVDGRGDDAGLIGLAFEPIRGREVPEVRGVLWLDRHSAELRFLEYNYTGLPLPWSVPTDDLGGRVEFERLPSGTWIVRRWWIRMPMLQTTGGRLDNRAAAGAFPPRTTVLAGLREEGGEVAEVVTPPLD